MGADMDKKMDKRKTEIPAFHLKRQNPLYSLCTDIDVSYIPVFCLNYNEIYPPIPFLVFLIIIILFLFLSHFLSPVLFSPSKSSILIMKNSTLILKLSLNHYFFGEPDSKLLFKFPFIWASSQSELMPYILSGF